MGQSIPCVNNCGRNTKFADGICKYCKAARNDEKRAIACERCGQPRGVTDERYCEKCGKVVLLELKSSGFLQQVPGKPAYRDSSKKENTRETKFGVDR